MDIHYNAFISYRHHPEDIKVAETIHRSLERFKVPKALKKEGKCIERIFRDKEELPITSSLTDTITMALRNSDYQIVICSTHLKDSYWVQREIETFLQTHSKDKVLTVLVDGDNPYDVIPEILTYEDVVDPVTGETFREPIEPLSCDWRLPKREAMKKELPRLAAVLLGCTYDDLIQRQKQYRQRRLLTGISIGMAGSLALAGYFMYTSIQIQENLNQALRNQSQYLASAAQDKFDNGDRLTAISLALAGLPSEDNPRPYVAAAEHALSNALMLYEEEGNLISVASFDAESSVQNFVVTDDGNTIYVMDNQHMVTAWDTTNFNKLSTFSLLGGKMLDGDRMLTDNNGNLITLGNTDGLNLMSHSSDGTLLWEHENIEDFVLCSGKNTLLALRRVKATRETEFRDSFELLQIDPNNGRLLAQSAPMFTTGDLSSPIFSAETYYENQPISIIGYHDSQYVIAVLNPVTETLRTALTFDSFFYGSTVTEDNLLYVLVTENEDVTNGRLGNYYFYTENGAYLHCIDMNTCKQKWKTHITSYNYSEANMVAPIPNSDRLFCQYGSAFLQIDAKTGKILEQCHSTNIPLTIQMRDTSAWVLFTNGCAGSYTFSSNQLGYIQYMENGLLLGHNNRGIYVHPQLTSSVLLYRSTNDDSYELFSGEYDDYIGQILFHGDTIVTMSSGTLNVMSASKQAVTMSTDVGYTHTLLGFNDDGTKVYAYKYQTIVEFDIATGASTEWTLLPTEKFNGYGMYYNCVAACGNTVCCMIYPYGGTECSIVFTDSTTHESTVIPLPIDSETANWSAYGQTPTIMDMTEEHVLFFAGTGTIYRYDRLANTLSIITESSPSDYVFLTELENDRMYFRTADGILVTDGAGTQVQTIPLTDFFAVSMFRHEDLLLVLCSDGMVRRYDLEGNLLGRTALSVFTSFFAECNNIYLRKIPVTWGITPDNELVVNAFRLGNVINMETWEMTNDVSQLVVYIPETDRFICQSNDKIYAYPRRSLAETMELAKTVLNGFELSEELKTYYGLN